MNPASPPPPFRAFSRVVALALALAVGASSPGARATTVTPVTIEALADRADAVLLVTPRTSQSHWEGGLIVTDVELDVQSVVRGDGREGASVVLRVPGGEVDHLAQRVPGVPALAVGTPYLVFVSRAPESGVYYLTHLTASVLRVSQSDPSGPVMVMPPDEGMRVAGTSPTGPTGPTMMRTGGVPLENLVSALRARAGSAR